MRKRVLYRNTPVSFMLGAILGGVLGLGLMMMSIQLHTAAASLLYGEEGLMQSGYVVINKPVTLVRTFAGSAPTFDEKDLQELSEQVAITEVAPFESSTFQVTAYLQPNDATPPFYTHLFFEALPDGFVDFDQSEWSWEEGQESLPVVIPRQYLTLYNFGFATSQNLPQVSEGVIKNVSFNVQIGDQAGSQDFEGRIISFSDRINSILVPHSFMKWANEHYGYQENAEPSRVALKVEDESDPALAEFLEENGYQRAGEADNGAGLKRFVDTTFAAILGLSIVILLLTVLIILVSFQVLVFRNRQNIANLFDIGHSVVSLQRSYAGYLGLISVVILIGAWALLFPGYTLLSDVMESKGLPLINIIPIPLVGVSTGLVILLFALNWLSMRRQLLRIFWGK